ncbi:MAG TPA: hypothetical protein DET40_06700 [Lentisphaeria bacterium]|nr:MAG: hypothetical protein A2X45_01090 [Lentisphaerae bacterium GWF2_50_93]HCE43218.1 hypothetical protein [Lentisphaeria bacterium]
MKTQDTDKNEITVNFNFHIEDKVPQRLSDGTRALAARYLSGEFGRSMSDIQPIPPAFYRKAPTQTQLYSEAIRIIAENAALRIIQGEKLAGAATLKTAMCHTVPVLNMPSVSHTTIGFEKALSIGYRGIRKEIEERLDRKGLDDEGRDLLKSMLSCLDSAKIWHQRYIGHLEDLIAKTKGESRKNYKAILKSLKNVPENPPSDFREAVQSLWMLWDFQRLCGNWSGIGRIDKMLGPYLKRDLSEGEISIDEARELIAHFWIKGCEWITAEGKGSGDAQFYQNIVLAGVDESGNDITNEVTYLVLDVVEELHISDFPIAVRLSKNSPEKLLRRTAEVQRLGGGIIAVYNDDRIIPSLVKFGYPIEEARNFANDGCWEVLIPGKTSFGYNPFDALKILQETLGLGPVNKTTVDFKTFDELYSDFEHRLATFITGLINSQPTSSSVPTVLIDLLVEGCIEKGRSYYNLGPKYTVRSPHAGGLPDAANSLLVIRKLVYEEKKFTLAEFMEILRGNWQGHEDLRRMIRSRFDFFGNDSEESDGMMRKVFDTYTDLVGKVRCRNGILRPAGISTFGREMDAFLADRTASASGSVKGDILASNFTPSPGTDKRGPTAIIKSHCSVDFSRLPCGTALDIKIIPSSLKGELGINALVGMMKTFVHLGGIFMQIDAVDTRMLRDAQEHPEKYPNLSVRVSGWSARFATLAKNWQELIINRSEQKI